MIEENAFSRSDYYYTTYMYFEVEAMLDGYNQNYINDKYYLREYWNYDLGY